MIFIVKIMGGLASQIHKYILGMRFAKELDCELVLDLSDYYEGYFRPYRLNKLGITELRTIKSRNTEAVFDNVVKLNSTEDILKMLKNSDKSKSYYFWKEETDFPDFFLNNNSYEMSTKSPGIEGIKPVGESSFLNAFRNSIEGVKSVAVHVRRGDFVTLGWESEADYYFNAIEYAKEIYNDAEFYFFSNDMEWTKKTFGDDNGYHYVSSSDKDNADIDEFFAMAYTDIRILSPHSGYALVANIVAGINKKDSFAISPKYETDDYEYQDTEGRIRYI